MPDRDKLQEFTAWCMKHITGDEKVRRKSSSTGTFKPLVSPAALTQAARLNSASAKQMKTMAALPSPTSSGNYL